MNLPPAPATPRWITRYNRWRTWLTNHPAVVGALAAGVPSNAVIAYMLSPILAGILMTLTIFLVWFQMNLQKIANRL